MRLTTRTARTLTALVAIGALAACGGGGGSGDGTGTGAGAGAGTGSKEKVRLVVNDWGHFGYEKLIKKYMRLHPNIQVVERQTEFNQHHEKLAQHLAAGSGTADIEAIDESFIVKFKAQADLFYNLLDYGAGDIKNRWLGWKWSQSLAKGGTYQIGLGTDVGGLAMCYRRDLFKQAGLPTDRDEVSKLWPTWEDFIAVGKKFEAAGTGAHWVDAATNMFNPILRQQEQGYYDQDANLIVDSNPGLRNAWDLTAQMTQAGESAKLTAFTGQWTAAMKKGTFATVACPAWMMGYVQDNAPKTKGKWDIASIPGEGGNWGGSFLTIPKQSEHPKEAYQLAAWLTAPEQELAIFKDTGNLPSEPELYGDTALKGFKNPFFNNAPVGEIFTQSAQGLQPQYLGPADGEVRVAFENALRQVEKGKLSSDQGWARAVKDAKRAAESG